MGSRIHTNLHSLKGQRSLTERVTSEGDNLRRLGSGLRTDRAADDPAALGISQRLSAEIRSLGQASRNAQAGIDLGRSAEAALGETQDQVARLRELAVQAGNETLGAEDRAVLQAEADAIVESLGDAPEAVAALSDAETLQVGSGEGETVDVPAVVSTAAELGVDSVDFADPALSAQAIDTIDTAIERLSRDRGSLGSFVGRLESTQRATVRAREELVGTDVRLSSLDFALETAERTQNRILNESGVAGLLQANVSAERAQALLG